MLNSVTYPFAVFSYPDGTSKDVAYIPLRIKNTDTGKHIDSYALIDTGADENLFRRDIAEQLGHAFMGDGVVSSINGGIGGTAKTYKHTFSLELFGTDITEIVWQGKPTLTDCIDADIPILLGVSGFLEFFKLEVDYPNKTISLSW